MVVVKRKTLIIFAVLSVIALTIITTAVSVTLNPHNNSVQYLGNILPFIPVQQVASLLQRPAARLAARVFIGLLVITAVSIFVYLSVIAVMVVMEEGNIESLPEEGAVLDTVHGPHDAPKEHSHLVRNVLIGVALFVGIVLVLLTLVYDTITKPAVEHPNYFKMPKKSIPPIDVDKRMNSFRESYMQMTGDELIKVITENMEKMGKKEFYSILPQQELFVKEWLKRVKMDAKQQLYMIIMECHLIITLKQWTIEEFEERVKEYLTLKLRSTEYSQLVQSISALLRTIKEPKDVDKFNTATVNSLVERLAGIVHTLPWYSTCISVHANGHLLLSMLAGAGHEDLVEFALATTDSCMFFKDQL